MANTKLTNEELKIMLEEAEKGSKTYCHGCNIIYPSSFGHECENSKNLTTVKLVDGKYIITEFWSR